MKRLGAISAAAAGALAKKLHREAAELDIARIEHARREDMTIACKQGCNACCRPAVMAYEPEAVAVAQWLLTPRHAAVRGAFEQTYPAWRQQLGDDIDRMMELDEANDSAGSQIVYDAIKDKNVMCAFNHDGDCTIYPARPNVCRFFVALDTSEYCQANAPRGPTMMGYLPYDEFMDRAQLRLRDAHTRLRKTKPEPLCDGVHRLLADPGALAPAPRQKLGRNAPCPCGSGTKYKRCCGR